ncbi:response regulator transcription factor [Microbulbifer epialgicus]|uniref:Response regulator n=1 Tax=Microbulbifer epialgicus TaxID=393907 RepID=A0ABV4NV92_9GAMM
MQRILIMDSCDSNLSHISEILKAALENVELIQAKTLLDGVKNISNQYFSLVLLNLNFPDGSGFKLIGEIKSNYPQTHCIVTTLFSDHNNIFSALSAGAYGYILLNESFQHLVEHVQGIPRGVPPLSPTVARIIIKYFKSRSEIKDHENTEICMLTRRERDVLQLLSEGCSRKKIATNINVSVHTAADYLKSIYRKLDVSSSAEATRKAIKTGLVQ